jgi:hypothetical protein
MLFSLFFYGFIPAPWRAHIYLSDTSEDELRFWGAFAVGAISGLRGRTEWSRIWSCSWPSMAARMLRTMNGLGDAK